MDLIQKCGNLNFVNKEEKFSGLDVVQGSAIGWYISTWQHKIRHLVASIYVPGGVRTHDLPTTKRDRHQATDRQTLLLCAKGFVVIIQNQKAKERLGALRLEGR